MYPRVSTLKFGQCTGSFKERFSLKNPFNSIHAAALINFGELIGGLAVMSLVEKQKIESSTSQWQGIVKKLGAEYHRKARGVISGRCELPDTLDALLKSSQFAQKGSDCATGPCLVKIPVELYDSEGQNVATVTAHWTFRQRPLKRD